ncbi:hypothetical protein KTT66_10940, partial [Lacticaseibacillus casei]|uniref:hypothetical protein n=1 Tax=Lacticaseibacillus casei TaxID=1582 RepID=UPI001C382C00
IITGKQYLSITFSDALKHISVAHLRRLLSYQRFAPSSTTFLNKNTIRILCVPLGIFIRE